MKKKVNKQLKKSLSYLNNLIIFLRNQKKNKKKVNKQLLIDFENSLSELLPIVNNSANYKRLIHYLNLYKSEFKTR